MHEIRILLAEDDDVDAMLTRKLLLESPHRVDVAHVSDGEACLRYLRQEAPYESAPRPDLLLLDLNMPRQTGHQVLDELRHHADLCDMPVVVWTTSSAQRDVQRSYALCANSHITKPSTMEGMRRTIRALDQYWFGVVKLPSA